MEIVRTATSLAAPDLLADDDGGEGGGVEVNSADARDVRRGHPRHAGLEAVRPVEAELILLYGDEQPRDLAGGVGAKRIAADAVRLGQSELTRRHGLTPHARHLGLDEPYRLVHRVEPRLQSHEIGRPVPGRSGEAIDGIREAALCADAGVET